MHRKIIDQLLVREVKGAFAYIIIKFCKSCQYKQKNFLHHYNYETRTKEQKNFNGQKKYI